MGVQKMNGREILEQFTRRWKWKKAAELFIRALSVAVIAGAFSFYWQFGLQFSIVLMLLVLLPVLFFLYYYSEFRSITPFLSARYLDREVPGFGYSSGLFLRKKESLNLPERLQYKRVEQTLNQFRMPSPPVRFRNTLIFLIFSLLFSSGLVAWKLKTPSSAPGPMDQMAEVLSADKEETLQRKGSVPSLSGGEIVVSPPAYTGLNAFKTKVAAVEVPEGSTLRWTIQFSDTVRNAWLSLSSGDSVTFRQEKNQSLSAKLRLEESQLYQVLWKDELENSGASDFYRLEVVPDHPPFIQPVKPNPFKKSTDPAPFSVEVMLEDDYGLTDAYLQLTVSSGSGEGVSFTEQKLSFNHDFKKGENKLRFRKILDPKALGMEPGNELYFFIVAKDNHPQQQQSRSETFLFQWEDTAAVSGFEVDGMAMDIMPEYFRSQRQIIIDTEKLLKEQPGLSDKDFEKRSNNLGVDQKLLRLRYGKFLGEEFESGYGQEVLPEVEEEDKHKEEESGSHEHQHESEHQKKTASAENLLSEFMHAHDTEEGATFYEESIKVKLKAALAEMWESELRLRTLKPADALPYQYRALDIIKEVQQATRVYVERIGFEPPPLKPIEKRLTGSLEDVQSGFHTTLVPSNDSLESVRKAVALLQAMGKGKIKLKEEELRLFREAGNALAAIATVQPEKKYLLGLRLLNGLLNEQEPGKTNRQYLLHTLMEVLPSAGSVPQAPQLYRSQLERTFIEEAGGAGE